MLSMKDIAKLSGVSLKTVSRVLNNSDKVKDETRMRVMAVVEEHGYTRNIIAKSLRERKTRTIIIFIDRHDGEYWGIWHTMILTEFMRQAKDKAYKIIVSPSSANELLNDETDGFALLRSGLADGAILMDNIEDDRRVDYLMKHNIPHVILGNCSNYSASHWVDLNNFNAGYMGGEYLRKKGYKSICFLVGDSSFIVNQERVKGFEKAMIDTKAAAYSIEYGISTTSKAYDIVNEQLQNKVEVDAYFVSGDERAIGVYRALQEKGLRIPIDIAILGIDNIPLCEFLYPSLTSINQPVSKFAEQVMAMLIDLIENSGNVYDNVLLPYELIEREST